MIYEFKGMYKNKPLVQQYTVNLIKSFKLHTRKTGHISIRFTNNMSQGCDDHIGSCLGDRKYASILISRKQSFLSQMRCLAHEMIHAKQFLRGELSPSGTVWKGTYTGDMKYGTEPFEIEAYDGEDALFMKTFPFDMM